jgi:hypothetical protein
MIGSIWRRLIWGGVSLFIVVVLILLVFGKLHAQVTPGTVGSKTLDGVGNKITSTVSGADIGLDVNCLNCGAGGATYLDADGIANQTASAVHGQTYMYNGATWDRVRGSILTGLEVNCVTGCAGGASTPSDAFANPVTAGLQMGFNMVYNGATWDRLRGTVAGGALVNISNASLAVTGTFFQATQPVSGTVAVSNAFLLDATFTGRFAAAYVDADNIANQTTTAIHGQTYIYDGATWDRWTGAVTGSGNFTVVQPTGTNLHIVCDSGCGGAATFADNAAFTFGTTSINNMGAVVDDTATNTVTENSAGAPRMNTNRILYSMPTNSTGTALYPTAAVEADAIANPTLTQIGTFMHGYNGATWDRLRSTIASGLLVDVSDAFVLDATLTNRFPAGSTPADNESNAVTISRIGNFAYIFDGAAWDRWTGAVTQSGTWNIGTVTTVTTVGTLTTITNPVTVTDGAGALNVIVDSGTLTAVTSITNPVTVTGNKTNNNAAPGATNVGVLPCIATAAVPASTEGNQVGCSTNLSGATRVINESSIATANLDGSCPSGAASFTVAASNASRTWLAMWASPANTDDVYIKLGATATSADGRFAPGQPINFTSGRIYTGVVDAFPASGTQAVCVMELN